MKHSNLHILIAEDDADDGEVISESFQKHGAFHKVTLVNNGLELLEALEKGESPDVILTDINMPILNGIEALRQINSEKNYAQIPAFVYSTTINPVYEKQCVELGSRGFLIKPYDLQGFDDIPEKILALL